MQYQHAALGSNKIFNVALRRKCLPAPGLEYHNVSAEINFHNAVAPKSVCRRNVK